MSTEPNEHVDEKLREAFAVDDTAATRVAGRVLAGASRRATRAPLGASLALAAVALCAGLAAWLSRPTVSTPPGLPARAVTELSGSLVDGVLIVPMPGDAIVIAGSNRREDRPPDGSGIVFVEGDVR